VGKSSSRPAVLGELFRRRKRRKGGAMFIQGNLQIVFDALYHMGIIDPVLKMDWNQALEEFTHSGRDFSNVVSVVNNCHDDVDKLMKYLQEFDAQSLQYLAMEVAKEYADYYERETLH
jgi:hypothetical protein